MGKICLFVFFLQVIFGTSVVHAKRQCRQFLDLQTRSITQLEEITYQVTSQLKPTRTQFPHGFWKNLENLDRVIHIILSKRESAFLHDLKNDEMKDLQDQFILAFGLGLNGTKLGTNIRTLRLTDQWAEALGRADHPKTIKEQTQQRVKAVLQERVRLEQAIDVTSIKNDDSLEFRNFLKKVFQEDLSTDAFIQRARKAFGIWPNVLAAINESQDDHSRRVQYLRLSEVKTVLKFLIKKDVNLNVKKFRNSKDLKIFNYIEQASNRKLSPYQFYQSAIAYKQWYDLISELDTDPRLYQESSVEFTESEIVKVIIAAYQTPGVFINTISIENDTSEEGRRIVKQAIGLDFTLQRIYRFTVNSKKFDRTWIEWLSFAGLDVTKIVLGHKIPYHLVNAISQASLRDLYGYRIQYLNASIGFESNGDNSEAISVDENTPEAELLKKEFFTEFQDFSDQLNNDEKALLDELIIAIGEGLDISKILSAGLQTEIYYFSADQVRGLFLKIKDHPRFIDLFLKE